MSQDENVSLAFDLIRRYAEIQGWIPIGWRVFTVGPWEVTVNGTKDERDGVPPYHAMVHKPESIGMALIHPFGGKVAGWKTFEDDFIAAMSEACNVH